MAGLHRALIFALEVAGVEISSEVGSTVVSDCVDTSGGVIYKPVLRERAAKTSTNILSIEMDARIISDLLRVRRTLLLEILQDSLVSKRHPVIRNPHIGGLSDPVLGTQYTVCLRHLSACISNYEIPISIWALDIGNDRGYAWTRRWMGPYGNCGPDVGASARVGLGEPATEAMSRNGPRGQKAPERQPESHRSIDRQRILDRADTAFYATAQTFLSEFDSGEVDLYPDEADADPHVYETDDGRRVACSGGTATQKEDVRYWAAQVEAALDQLGVDAGVTERLNGGDIAVTPREIDSREERAGLIRDLERRGFTVTSPSSAEYIYVDAASDRLPHEFTDFEGGDE